MRLISSSFQKFMNNSNNNNNNNKILFEKIAGRVKKEQTLFWFYILTFKLDRFLIFFSYSCLNWYLDREKNEALVSQEKVGKESWYYQCKNKKKIPGEIVNNRLTR